MRKLLNSLLLGLTIISCTNNKTDTTAFETLSSTQTPGLNHRDSLILNYVVNEFPMRSSDTLSIIRELLHKDLYKEIVMYPEGHKFRLYDFRDALYDPFVITVANVKDSLISLFSFTDEVSYSSENKYWKHLTQDKLTIEPNPYRRTFGLKRNLEENLNNLIAKLGYQNDHRKVMRLLDVILIDLLEMERPNYWQKRSILKYLDNFKTNNQEIIKAIEDFRNLDKTERDCNVCFLYQTEGLFGYWLIEFNEQSQTTEEALIGTIKLKVNFISEVLYMPPMGVD